MNRKKQKSTPYLTPLKENSLTCSHDHMRCWLINHNRFMNVDVNTLSVCKTLGSFISPIQKLVDQSDHASLPCDSMR